MNNFSGAAIIISMCFIILLIVLMKQRAELLLNFLIRGIVGGMIICAVNKVMISQQMEILVGLNPYTVLTSGFLGIPGVAMLYGIHLLNFL